MSLSPLIGVHEVVWEQWRNKMPDVIYAQNLLVQLLLRGHRIEYWEFVFGVRRADP